MAGRNPDQLSYLDEKGEVPPSDYFGVMSDEERGLRMLFRYSRNDGQPLRPEDLRTLQQIEALLTMPDERRTYDDED